MLSSIARLNQRLSGPYAEAILRFQISFPDTYPSAPPLVTFSTDVFHPLVVPLTTYTFSANVDASSNVSASDDHRLPPGAFSLRYGFPEWFAQGGTADGTTTRKRENASDVLPSDADRDDADGLQEETSEPPTQEETPSSRRPTTTIPTPITAQTDRQTALLSLLRHIHASFTDPSILDILPLASAGNPSAWHAWRAHRSINAPTTAANATTGADTSGALSAAPATDSSSSTSPSSPKTPSAWKWDGVWESRVESAIRESIAEGTLFGSAGSTTASGSAALGLGQGLFVGGSKVKADGASSRFGSSGGGLGAVPGSSAPAAGALGVDDRQRSQALADRQIRFAKLPDEGLLDVRRRVGLTASIVDGGR